MVDTGSNINCIKHSLVKDLPIETTSKQKLFTANKQKLNVQGTIILPISMGKNEFLVKCLVISDLAVHLILGNRFLFQNSIEISYRDKEIHIFHENSLQRIPMKENWYLNLSNANLISTFMENQNIPNDKHKEIRTDREIILKPRQHVKLMDLTEEFGDYKIDLNLTLRDKKKIFTYIMED